MVDHGRQQVLHSVLFPQFHFFPVERNGGIELNASVAGFEGIELFWHQQRRCNDDGALAGTWCIRPVV